MRHFSLLVRILFWLACLLVAFGSLLPGDELPSIASNDKLLHLFGHGGLAFLGSIAYRRHVLALISGLACFGAGLELLQQWVPNRSFDWLDMLANISGVLLAVLIAQLGWRWHDSRAGKFVH